MLMVLRKNQLETYKPATPSIYAWISACGQLYMQA